MENKIAAARKCRSKRKEGKKWETSEVPEKSMHRVTETAPSDTLQGDLFRTVRARKSSRARQLHERVVKA